MKSRLAYDDDRNTHVNVSFLTIWKPYHKKQKNNFFLHDDIF